MLSQASKQAIGKPSVALLSIASIAILALAAIPVAHAYGAANWQVGFAGTILSPGSGRGFGFWGWCALAGGTGSPATSGTDADCKIDNYAGSTPSGGFQLQASIQGTAWDEEPCTIPPCLTPNDFFITAGSMTISGPTVVQLLQSGVITPNPFCTISGSTVTCPLWFFEFVGLYNPDTGIPTAAGHYNGNTLVHLLGFTGEFQIQVTQLS